MTQARKHKKVVSAEPQVNYKALAVFPTYDGFFRDAYVCMQSDFSTTGIGHERMMVIAGVECPDTKGHFCGYPDYSYAMYAWDTMSHQVADVKHRLPSPRNITTVYYAPGLYTWASELYPGARLQPLEELLASTCGQSAGSVTDPADQPEAQPVYAGRRVA